MANPRHFSQQFGWMEQIAAGLFQSPNRSPALGYNRLRPALAVGPVGVQVDAQVAIDGGTDVGGGDAAGPDLAAAGVGAADHLAVAEAAACHQDGHATEPVFAAAGAPLRKLRRSAKLAHHQH